eukprot:gene20017-7108_t
METIQRKIADWCSGVYRARDERMHATELDASQHLNVFYDAINQTSGLNRLLLE